MDQYYAFVAAHPLIAVALGGLFGAMLVDIRIFLSTKTPGEFFGQFEVSTAAWRWLQGAVGAAVGTLPTAGVIAAKTAVIGTAIYRWFFVLALVAFVSVGCAKPDTSKLSPDGLRFYQCGQAARVIADVTDAVIAANKANQLTDVATAQILIVDKQVNDVVRACPGDWRTAAAVILKNSRDALPAELKARLDGYALQLQTAITEVR